MKTDEMEKVFGLDAHNKVIEVHGLTSSERSSSTAIPPDAWNHSFENDVLQEVGILG